MTHLLLDANGRVLARVIDHLRPELKKRGAHFLYFVTATTTPIARDGEPVGKPVEPRVVTSLITDMAADVVFEVADDEEAAGTPGSPSMASPAAGGQQQGAPWQQVGGLPADVMVELPTTLEQSRVNQSKTSLRRLLQLLQRAAKKRNVDGNAALINGTARESQLTKILIDYLSGAHRAVVVSVLPTCCDAESALHTLVDAGATRDVKTMVDFDQTAVDAKKRGLDDELTTMMVQLERGWSQTVLDRREELERQDEAAATFEATKASRLEFLDVLQRRVVEAHEAAIRGELMVEHTATHGDAAQNHRVVRHDDRVRVRERREAEEAASKPQVAHVGVMCTIDQEEEARVLEEAKRNEEAISRCHTAIAWSSRRRRRMQMFTAAQACVQRDLRIHQHANVAMQRRIKQLEDHLVHCDNETQRLSHIEETHRDLEERLKKLPGEIIERADERDAEMAALSQETDDLRRKRDTSAKDVEDATREVDTATAEGEPVLRKLRLNVSEKEEAYLTTRGRFEAVETENDVLEHDVRRWEERRAELRLRLERAKSMWDEWRRRDAALPPFAVGEQRQMTARAGEEAAEAVSELQQADDELADAVERVAGATRHKLRLEKAIQDANCTIREHGLPDARPLDFPDDAALSDVVRTCDASARLQDRDLRAQVTATLLDRQATMLETMRSASTRSASARSRSRQ